MNVRSGEGIAARLIFSVALLLCARNGAAQNLSLELNNGLVTLVAREVPLVKKRVPEAGRECPAQL